MEITSLPKTVFSILCFLHFLKVVILSVSRWKSLHFVIEVEGESYNFVKCTVAEMWEKIAMIFDLKELQNKLLLKTGILVLVVFYSLCKWFLAVEYYFVFDVLCESESGRRGSFVSLKPSLQITRRLRGKKSWMLVEESVTNLNDWSKIICQFS